ncbi:MAG: cyclopropane-fatty-acyl-phospholipid synthase family protein [Rhodospirillales bacterium]|nr:cyclopropane-fatty-acyl-phospholipid synthase family protein [Rhodospirillales bacterium]
MLFRNLLKFMVREGTVRLIDSRGRSHLLGNGAAPRCTLRMQSRRLDYTPPFNPSLYFCEAYMNGDITFEDGCLADFLEIARRNYGHLERYWLVRFGNAVTRQTRRLKQHNPIGKARRNVAHHYDLSAQLYDLFLDRDRQYSCAYFTAPHDDLDKAQDDKKRHIAAKLLLNEAGLKVLDIGSGWGGMGLYLAEHTGCEVTGVTLSVEQHKLSREKAQRAGLDRRVRFHLRDYREETAEYDRIVSVGMFEHVGKKHYDEFFAKVRDLLSEDGVCLLHSIGRFDEPGPVNPFMRKYIFPGADLPTLAEVLPSIERAGLMVTDVEILRLHYAETLRIWHDRFQANRAKVAELYDERFCRMWEIYLKGCEMGFRHEGLMVFQIQLAKNLHAVPLTRDYMHEWEHEQKRKRAQAAE